MEAPNRLFRLHTLSRLIPTKGDEGGRGGGVRPPVPLVPLRLAARPSTLERGIHTFDLDIFVMFQVPVIFLAHVHRCSSKRRTSTRFA